MLPRIFGEDLFDDFFNDDFMMRPMRNTVPQMMKTDVRELDGAYELDMDLPGFKKEDIKVDLKDGTLTISAAAQRRNQRKRRQRQTHSPGTLQRLLPSAASTSATSKPPISAPNMKTAS